MSNSFIGEIDWFAFDYIPRGYFACDGRTYNIQSYPALFTLLGKTYGGDGKTTFAVPNLAARVVAGLGTAPSGTGTTVWQAGTTAGSETVSVSLNQYPPHSHSLNVVAGTLTTGVAGGVFGGFSPALQPAVPPTDINIDNTAFLGAYTGGGGAHDNMQPYLVLLPAICWDGLYPDFP